MFDISFTELMVIGAVALIVIGPARLPKVARTVGHLMGRAQRYVNDVKADIHREVELDELRKLKEEMNDAANDVQSSFKQGEAALRATQDSIRSQVNEVESLTKSALDTSSPAADAADASADPVTADTPTIAPPAPEPRPGPWADTQTADDPSSTSNGKTP